MHLNEVISSELSSPLAKLRAKAREFNAAYETLLARKPDPAKDPALFKKWQTLQRQGAATRASIGRILGIADWVGNAASSVWDYVTSSLDGNDDRLGLVPIAITGAVIASSMAGMTYFITETYKFAKIANASPEVRDALLKKEKEDNESGIKGILSSTTGLIAVAGLIYFLPKVLKGRK